MYSLVVTNAVEAWAGHEPITIDQSRFLEYTGTGAQEQLSSLSRQAVAAIKSWPAILMQEGRGGERAHVGRVTSLVPGRGELRLSFAPLEVQPLLANDSLWKQRTALDIEQFEFSRHHWAVKNRDLLAVLSREGHHVRGLGEFRELPLPAPTRREVLTAKDIIGNWSHTAIDDLLLEIGVKGIAAGRGLGSRRDRSNEIARFILDNPGAITAERELLSAFFVSAAEENEYREAFELQSETEEELDLQATADVVANQERREPARVFVVHGRNDDSRRMVADFLIELGLSPVILHEQPNMGRHLLTKFIDEAELATFAVVIMTDDDVGGLTPDSLAPRARQNVILELGYFIAHLGQPRVCALMSPGLETPSDFDGIVYIPMGDSEDWRATLERELIAANMPVRERQP